MIKILVLLATISVVVCKLLDTPFVQDLGGIDDIKYSRGIERYYTKYHEDFQQCLDRRENDDHFERWYGRPFKGFHCSQSNLTNEFTYYERFHIWNLLYINRQEIIAEGKEERGNPGPQFSGLSSNLQYDDDLAADAWRWARECTPGRDPCTLLNDTVGQTVISVVTPKKDTYTVRDLWLMWYNEIVNFDKNTVCNFSKETEQKAGNFTQLVWGKTAKFGCAKSVDYYGQYRTTFVCNYHPPGNIIGRRVYNARHPVTNLYLCPKQPDD